MPQRNEIEGGSASGGSGSGSGVGAGGVGSGVGSGVGIGVGVVVVVMRLQCPWATPPNAGYDTEASRAVQLASPRFSRYCWW